MDSSDCANMRRRGFGSVHSNEQAKEMLHLTMVQAGVQTGIDPSYSLRRTAKNLAAVGVVLVLATLCLPSESVFAQAQTSSKASPPTMATVAQWIDDGDLATAIDAVTEYDDQVIREGLSDVDTTLLLAQIARSCENEGKDLAAAELYLRACAASKRTSTPKLSEPQIATIKLAAGSSFVRAGKYEQAVATLADALQAPPLAAKSNGLNLLMPAQKSEQEPEYLLSPRQRATAGHLLMLLGSEALGKKQSTLAEQAYKTALPHVSGDTLATVMLGQGWAIAMQDGRDADAAEALNSFIAKHPDHRDVASAARLCIGKLKAAGDVEGAEAMTSRLLTRWPETKAASDLIAGYSSRPVAEIPNAAKKWLVGRSLPERIGQFDARTAATALRVALDLQQSAIADQLLAHLAAVDESGQSVSDVLQRLSESPLSSNDQAENSQAIDGLAASAQQIAARLMAPALAPAKDNTELETAANSITVITPAAREAACRWAGRQQLWSMLAMASEASNVDDEESSRTITVERLFAESLMQTGRADEAQKWWNHLVDSRGVNDFATLLRCAETATSYADVPTARNRIADARVAADDTTNKISLVEMLSAELSVRELKFDEARSTLETVVRSEGAISALRGRAQWTIGETYYLQQRFADAIEAYRKVEGIDPEGTWIAVSLVQAGKAFEQLGRTREAAVCYSTLASRFAESPHAVSARRRLAAIDPSSHPTTDTFRR